MKRPREVDIIASLCCLDGGEYTGVPTENMFSTAVTYCQLNTSPCKVCMSLILYREVVNKCATGLNVKAWSAFCPRGVVNVFRVIVQTNSDCLLIQHQPVRLCNRNFWITGFGIITADRLLVCWLV